jgi:plasmid stability protein
MNLTIELSDESAARLKQQAAAHGLSLEAWVQALALEKARAEESEANRWKSQAAAARILEIQRRVKPDPEGWTVHDYIDRGRA